MGLESVKEEIIRNAKKHEESLIDEAREEARHIIEKARKESMELREKSDAETKKALDIIKRQEAASAELESKKMLLEAKKKIIDLAFAEAQKKLEKMEQKKREAIVRALLEKAGKEIGIGIVYCNKKDAKSIKGYKAEETEIIGGLIAENTDGTVRVDYSFDSMLQSVKESHLQEINKSLFEE